MPTLGTPTRFDLKYNFAVQIVGVSPGTIDFATCSEPSVAVGEATLWQGGSLVPVKEPTRLTFADVTLERGMSRDFQLYDWFLDTGDAAANKGVIAPLHKRNVLIYQYGRASFVEEVIHLYNAFVKEYGLGDWNNDSDEFRMERLVLGYDYFDRKPLVSQ